MIFRYTLITKDKKSKLPLRKLRKLFYILKGDIIEQYISDLRGESCLVVGTVYKKPLHIVCGIRNDRLLIVTVYRPKIPIWIDYKTRKKELKSRE